MVGAAHDKRKRGADASLEEGAGIKSGAGEGRVWGLSKRKQREEARRLVSEANAGSIEDGGVSSPPPGWARGGGDGAKMLLMGPVKPTGRAKGGDGAKSGCRGVGLPAERREGLCEWMMGLTERNMRELYEATWGWDANKKLRELRSTQARFIIVVEGHEGGGGAEERQPVAFLHYRFVEDARRPVLYVYEIQVVDAAQGKGYGHLLMRRAEEIAADKQMAKVVLTCFTINHKALAFYNKVGYSVDETCPSLDDGDEEACFTVLSKLVPEKSTPAKHARAEKVPTL